MKELLKNQNGLTLIEMLVTLLLFMLASTLIITAVSHVLNNPKEASILSNLQTYQLETDVLLREVGTSLSEDELKTTLNKNLDDKYRFDTSNKSKIVNVYGNPYTIDIKKETGKVAIVLSSKGKEPEDVYSLVTLYENNVTDYCTNGFERRNKKLTLLTSSLCSATQVVEVPDVKVIPPTVPVNDTLVCTNLQGSGTSLDPYKIHNGNDLNSIRKPGCLSKHYILMNDINLENWSTYNNGKGFSHIGVYSNGFTGTFDGGMNIIFNLPIHALYSSNINNLYVGLFGESTGTIKNLGLENADIRGDMNIYALGPLVGNNVGTITNCYSTGSLTGAYLGGGLVGINGGSVTYSYSEVNIKGAWNGGLAGENWGTISNSYSIGKVGEGLAGGLVASNFSTITNSYATGLVTNGGDGGGLVASNNMGGKATNSYWDKQTTNQATSYIGTGKTTTEMKQQSTYTGWDFTNVWAIDPTKNNGYPYLKNNPPN